MAPISGMRIIVNGLSCGDAYAGISSAKKLLIIHIRIQRLADVVRMNQLGYLNLSGFCVNLDFHKNPLPAHAVRFLYYGRFI